MSHSSVLGRPAARLSLEIRHTGLPAATTNFIDARVVKILSGTSAQYLAVDLDQSEIACGINADLLCTQRTVVTSVTVMKAAFSTA